MRIRSPVLPSVCGFALSLLLAGCSLDYDAVRVTDELDMAVPDITLEDVEYTVVRNARPLATLQADRSQTFERRDQHVLEDVDFTEFAADGAVATEGTADRAVVQTQTDNAELSGNIRVYSSREQATVEAQYFSWDDEERTVTGRENDEVRIETDDGSALAGTGFEADMRVRTARFREGVDGRFVNEEQQRDPDQEPGGANDPAAADRGAAAGAPF